MSFMDPKACQTRRLARIFTPSTPRHHPLLDPDISDEDKALVPKDLSPRGQLNWQLPKKTRTNLHLMLRLTHEADKILDEFHEKLPVIDEILSEWSEMRGASPTIKGLEQLRANSGFPDRCRSEEGYNGGHGDYIFNMVRNLSHPGRADIIYLTDAVEDTNMDTSVPPSDIRGVDWLDFDGSHIHLQDVGGQRHSECAVPETSDEAHSEGMERIPVNFQTSQWESEREAYLSPTIYSPSEESVPDRSPKTTGPFVDFWRHHEAPFGHNLVLGGDDDEPMSPCSPPLGGRQWEKSAPSSIFESQDPTHLMVPNDNLEHAF